VYFFFFFFFQAEDGIRDDLVTGVQTCALPISFRTKLGGQTFQQTAGPPEPRTLAAFQVTRHGGLFRQNFLRPPARFGVPLLGCRSEERRVGKECRCRWSRSR